MKKSLARLLWTLSTAILFTFLLGFKSSDVDSEEIVSSILQQNCAISGCHQGQYPAMNLNLEPDKFKASLSEVQSQQAQKFKRIDTGNPEKSYLLMKVEGNESIVGNRMPLNAPSLTEDEIGTIRAWISSLPQAGTSPTPGMGPKRPAFWGTRSINLVTPRSIGKNQFLFRVAHRYYPSIKEGYDVFYGLDGPASVFLSFGYGINDNLSLTLGRSNRFKEVLLSLKWVLFQQGMKHHLPFSAAVNLGTSLITESRDGVSIFSSENTKFSAQLSLSHQVNDSISLLLVPSYSSNTNHWEAESQGTFALGTGGRFMILNDISILLEWIPVLSGYQAKSTGWGLGLEKKIGGHVFQLFVLNVVGITPSQQIPGGDLDISQGDFRFGFNIYRWF